jgi:signal peptidase I
VRKLVKFLLWSAGIIAILLLIARLSGLRLWTVPKDPFLGASVAPTVFPGDLVVMMTSGERGANELVRCPDPEDSQRWVMGRIYGQAGETVSVLGTSVSVNGRRYSTTEACVDDEVTVNDPVSGAPKKLRCARVEFAGGWHFIAGGETRDTTPAEHKVGAGRVYLVSDNRVYHEDSRDFGAVMANTCTDRVLFRLWGTEGFTGSKRRFEFVR